MNIEMTELEERVQRLEDIEAIRQLKARYLHACDRKDIELIRSCFADGEIAVDYGAIGKFSDRDSFLDVYIEKACHEHIVDMHHGQNARIDWISPTEAKAVWDLYFFQIDRQASTLMQLAGYYEDEYRKEGEHWMIISTAFYPTSTYVSSATDGDVKVLFAGDVVPAE